MGRFTAYDQNGRMVADFDKSEHDFLRRYGRTPEEVLDENAKLIVKLNAEHIVRQNAEAENAKLRELCSDMLMCLTWQIEPHSYMMDGCDHCQYRGKTNGMCGLGMFRGRARELGIEVPS